jgi:hypothetical protein
MRAQAGFGAPAVRAPTPAAQRYYVTRSPRPLCLPPTAHCHLKPPPARRRTGHHHTGPIAVTIGTT